MSNENPEQLAIKEKFGIWEKTKTFIERRVDGNGRPIEQGVKDATIGLLVNSINTTNSCEGHLDRGVSTPWIGIGTQDEPQIKYEEQEIATDSICKKFNVTEEDIYANPRSQASKEYWKMLKTETAEYRKWQEANRILALRAEELLLSFYSKNDADPDIKIKIEDHFKDGVDLYCGLNRSERFAKMNDEQKAKAEKILLKRREEMKKFGLFLKEIFFKKEKN